jgi:hypothetical protein
MAWHGAPGLAFRLSWPYGLTGIQGLFPGFAPRKRGKGMRCSLVDNNATWSMENRWHQEELTKCGNERERGRRRRKNRTLALQVWTTDTEWCAMPARLLATPLELEMIRVMIASRFITLQSISHRQRAARACAPAVKSPRRSSFHLFSARRAPRLAARSGSGSGSAQPRGEQKRNKNAAHRLCSL